MSRYVTSDKDGHTAAYGFDHAVGYFVQVYGDTTDEEDVVLLLDEDSMFSKMNNGKMLALIQEWGIKIAPQHRERIALDLPF